MIKDTISINEQMVRTAKSTKQSRSHCIVNKSRYVLHRYDKIRAVLQMFMIINYNFVYFGYLLRT